MRIVRAPSRSDARTRSGAGAAALMFLAASAFEPTHASDPPRAVSAEPGTPAVAAGTEPTTPQVVPPAAERSAQLENAVKRARAELERRMHAPADEIRTISAQGILWLDASMGCGSPTESYAQVEAAGFQVVLEYSGKQYDFRFLEDGEPVLCDPGVLRSPRRPR